jgi:transposase-like protein
VSVIPRAREVRFVRLIKLGGLGDILKQLMSDDYQRIELITGTARRRRRTAEQKLRIIEASYAPGESVSSVARRHGVAPNLPYRWRRLMAEGGVAAVGSDETVVGAASYHRTRLSEHSGECAGGCDPAGTDSSGAGLRRTGASVRCRRGLPRAGAGCAGNRAADRFFCSCHLAGESLQCPRSQPERRSGHCDVYAAHPRLAQAQ